MAERYPQRLYRSTRDRMLGGVCGGLSEYFDVDPVLMRLAWVGFTFLAGGLTIPLYIILWIVVPKESDAERARSELWRQNADEMLTEARRLGSDVREAIRPSDETAAPAPQQAEQTEATVGESTAERPPTGETVEQPTLELPAARSSDARDVRARRQTWAAIVLVVLGLWLLASNLRLLEWIRGDLFWPLILIGAGAWLLYRQTVGRGR